MMKRHTLLTHLARAAGAGLVAGALAGAWETILMAVLGRNAAHLHASLWAAVAYGLLGLLAGLALGLILGLLAARGRTVHTGALTLAAILAGLALFLTRYRLYRDLFQEGIRTFSLQGLLFNGGLLAAGVLLFFLIYRLAYRLAKTRQAGITPPLRAAAAAYGLLLVAAVAVTLLTRPAGRHAAAPAGIPPGLENAPNIILIGVDTLRADRLSCYNTGASPTPHIDALAVDGVLYTAMTAQASWTKPSFATIMTSLYPSSHTATGKPDRLPQAVTTLAEALAAGGYHTGGIANNISIAAEFGFDQGFADYTYLAPDYLFAANEAASQLALYQTLRRAWAMVSGGRIAAHNFYQDASVVNRQAIDWLEANKDTRFFLFLHYMDPHDPYFEHPYNGRGYARASDQNPDPALAPAFSRLYDGEVAYVDEYLGRLFDYLKSDKMYNNSLIILTGDHGEEFQEHGGWWHGQTLYQEQLAVPLIVKYPGGARAGAVVADLTRSLDIAPTILDAAGLPIPDTMLGRSLWAASEPPAYAFAEEDLEGNVLYSVRTLTGKLIRANPDNPRGLPPEAFFDLAADPGEQQNLAASRPDQLQALRDLLRQALTLALERAVAGEAGALDAGVLDKLHDLGY